MTAPRMPGAGMVRRRPVINGDPSQIVGPPWTAGLYYFVLLAAAAVDIVTFQQVLVAAVDAEELILWIMVAGFTVVCLALSHTVGQQAKQSVSTRHVVGARTAALLSLFGWVALGVTAFVFRWNYAGTSGGGVSIIIEGQQASGPSGAKAQERHLAALFFLALYLATGVVAGVAGYLRHNPAARQYARALSRRSKAATKHAHLTSKLAAAAKLADAVDQAAREREKTWTTLQIQCASAAERLKNVTRLTLIEKAGGPPRLGEGPDQPNESEKEPR